MYKFRIHFWLSMVLLLLNWSSFSQTSPPSGTPQQANLQVYYPFDVNTPIVSGGPTPAQWSDFKKEASQTTLNGWSDISVANSGVAINYSGIRGSSLYSDGTSDFVASFENGTSQNNPINDLIDGTNSFTISFWYQIDYTDNNDVTSIIGKRSSCADQSNLGLNTFFDIRASDPFSSSNGKVRAEIEEHQRLSWTGNTGSWRSNSTSATLSTPSCNSWTHCTVTRITQNGNSAITKLYIDGTLRDSNSSPTVDIGIGESGVFEIGGSACIESDGTRHFLGSFDELMVYDVELSETEVAELYQAYASGLTVNVSGNTNICLGQSTTLTANASGGTSPGSTYLWSPGGQTTQSIIVSPTSSTLYTVGVSNSECQVFIPVVVNIVSEPILDPSFTVTSIECNSYDDYTVTLSGTGPGSHHWQVYSGNDMTTPAANEITSISIYGTTQFNVTINIPGTAGDNFVIKHGVYDQCVAWSEKKQLIELPCFSLLDSEFDLSYWCNDQSPEIKVKGISNPCNTKWVYQLYDGSVLVDQIGYVTNYTGEYDDNEYTFSGLEPCTEYTVKHGVWSDCIPWTQTTHSISTSNCPELSADFHFQNTPQGGPINIFYTCNSGIFFNGTASVGENDYYLDLWKYNPTSGQFDHLAYKTNTGWTSGQAGVFDLVSEFGSQGISFSPGTYKVKLAVSNNCNGWLPIEQTFTVEQSIGTPFVTFGTHDASLGTPVITTFILGDDIWIKSPLSGASANNLIDYRFELERIISYLPLATMPYATAYNGSGPIPLFELSSVFSILVHSEYRLTCFAINECGEEVSFSQDFEVIKPSPFKSQSNGNSNLEGDILNTSSLFPNPVTNNLYVTTSKEIDHIEIYSKSGQLISVHRSTSIEVSGLSPGIYVARIFGTDGSVEDNQFIKQ